MAVFRINYSRVISQANSMSNLAGDLSSEIRKLEGMLSDVRSNWKGPASEAYQRQLSNLIADMKRTKSKMTGVSSTIKSVARRIQAEDERAAERARKLNSGK
ncbi:MAG: WXG100 family type VII secretion target [Clostridia bacterium]|nr:WXG100 family type VII secretion target [Clostridia bacterium]